MKILIGAHPDLAARGRTFSEGAESRFACYFLVFFLHDFYILLWLLVVVLLELLDRVDEDYSLLEVFLVKFLKGTSRFLVKEELSQCLDIHTLSLAPELLIVFLLRSKLINYLSAGRLGAYQRLVAHVLGFLKLNSQMIKTLITE